MPPVAPRPHYPRGLYWTLQLAGWGAFALFSEVLLPLSVGARLGGHLPTALAAFVLGVGLSHAYRGLIRRRGWTRRSLPAIAPRIVLATAMLTLAATLPYLALSAVANDRPLAVQFSVHALAITAYGWGIPFVAWSLIYFAYHYAARVREAEAARWQMAAAAKEAELKALRAQLDPHFLFNALNCVRALVAEEPARAQEAVTRLSELLRYTLRAGRSPTVPLAEELDTVEHYLALEALRLEERLRYRIEANEAARTALVPPMLLQTLVENAVRHGVARQRGGGALAVEAHCDGGALAVRVTNTGSLDGAGAGGSGVGLHNARERLRLLYGDTASLSLTQVDGAVVAEVMLPIAREVPSTER